MHVFMCMRACMYLCLFIYNHVVPLAHISLTHSRHFSLSFIGSGRSSGLHPVSSHSCWMYVRAGRSAFARPYVGVHRSTSLMSSFLLLQQCPARLANTTASLQRCNPPTCNIHLDMTLNYIRWWGSSNTRALGNTEDPFIAIATRSTLTRSGSTW